MKRILKVEAFPETADVCVISRAKRREGGADMQAYPHPLPVSWRATANEGLKVPNLRLRILPPAGRIIKLIF
ncbi:hypothetical protein IO98_01545 [Lacrimispora celerecrescens]|uniref:Uncharacterized protein n=1 Tax=Lacrimispora celerecrescens TaxID=29354 RepID=A0A084JSE8_9FIRM|nr:hypothetical protein IO98_01545 [Lacrimispora celerecrescens]